MDNAPRDVLTLIFKQLDVLDIASVKLTCSFFKEIFNQLFWIQKLYNIGTLDNITSNTKIRKYLRCIRNVLLKKTNPIITCSNSYDRWYFHSAAQFFNLFSYTIIDYRQYKSKTTKDISNGYCSKCHGVKINLSLEPRSMVVFTYTELKSKKVIIGHFLSLPCHSENYVII